MEFSLEQEMPEVAAACRVCLAVDVRLLTLAGSLQLVYETITSTALHMTDGRPAAACYICYAQLNKCRKLMLTSARAENVLNAILHRQSKITVKSISQIDRKALGLCGSLKLCGTEQHNNYEVPPPIITKIELDSDVVNNDIKIEELDSPSAAAADLHDTECGSDEDDPGALSQPADTQLDIQELKLEEDVSPAQTPGADMKQAEGSTINGKQRESRRESTTRTAPGPHQCEICQRRFKKKYSLTNHLRTHTGEKPYACNVCQKRFSVSSYLQSHLKTHTGEKPFKCHVCKKQFNWNSDLTIHLRTHTGEKPFECNVCQKRFSVSSHLHSHLKTHTGEKPFKCHVCKKQFNWSCNLKIHLRTHTGEKPYECNVCQREFSQKKSLKLHLKTHSKKK